MASGQWPPAPNLPQFQQAQGIAPSGPPSFYDLRPLSLGEILDRTFTVYRSHFWLFAGIGALSGAVQLLSAALQLSVYHGIRIHHGLSAATIETQIGSSFTNLLFFLAAAITQAATVWAVSQVYLHLPASVEASVRAVIRQWLRFIGIALWQGCSLLWLPFALALPGVLLLTLVPGPPRYLGGVLIFLAVFGGIPVGVIFFLRNSLAVQAAVVEQLRVPAAMRRSKTLAAGTKGRIFVVFLIAWCLFLVAGMLQAPLLFIVARSPLQEHTIAQIVILLINFVAHTLVTPVALIGLSLVYFDQRVRQEALDLLLMLGGSQQEGQPPPPASQPAPSEPQTTLPPDAPQI